MGIHNGVAESSREFYWRNNMKRLWKDNRSGVDGKAIGNVVLDHLRKKIGGEVKHEKGTVFSNDRMIVVGRICTSDAYLTGSIVHFCNMSQVQHESLNQQRRTVMYLFITASNQVIHYWLVPGSVIGRVLPTLAVKNSTPSSIIRITREGKKFRLGNISITRYYGSISAKGARYVPRQSANSTLLATVK